MTTQEVASEVRFRHMLAFEFEKLNEVAKEIGKSIEGLADEFKPIKEQAKAKAEKALEELAESINTTPMSGMKVLGKKKAEKALEQQSAKKKSAEKAFALGSNGLIQYDTHAGAQGSESIFEREDRELYWRSLGKKIRNGSSVR